MSLIGLGLSCLPLQLATAQVSALSQQYEAAQRALTDGNYPEAQRAFEQLAQAHPEIAEIHANLGLIYFEERKFGEAVPELRRALKLKPALANSATILALSLSELGRYSEALPGLEKGFRSTDSETKRSEEHTIELQSLRHLVCRLLLEKKKQSNEVTST